MAAFFQRALMASCLTACVLHHGSTAVAEQPKPAGSKSSGSQVNPLSDADGKWLDQLVGSLVVDPKGAEFVAVPVKVRDVWAGEEVVSRKGWRVAGAAGKPARVYFPDGESMTPAADAKLAKIDFIASCRAEYGPVKANPEANDEVFARMRLGAVGEFDVPDLVNSVWLHRLGQSELAAEALEHAGEQLRSQSGSDDRGAKKTAANEREELVATVKEQFATAAFLAMVHAYMVRADDEAQAHAERLLKLNPDPKGDFSQVGAIVGELRRRKKKGTFGKTPSPKWPAGYEEWDAAKKVAWLIEALDEVDARQDGQPGGVDLGSDRRVVELIHVGDPAVPALIDAIENDKRLTRSVHFWRDFNRDRTVLSVREAALTAVMSILKTQFFEAAATGDNFTSRGEDSAKQMASRLRAYWKQYGGMPFDDRMMHVLTDPKASFEAKREAAANLATFGQNQVLHTMFHATVIGGQQPPKPNPVIAKFHSPTVADAILAAMDADLKAQDARPAELLKDYDRSHVEDNYLASLTELGDNRIAAELARRSRAAKTIRMRRKWAYAAHCAGDSRPLNEFADDFRLGKIVLPDGNDPRFNESDQAGNQELLGIVTCLAGATPDADRALWALADPHHPSYKVAAARIMKESAAGYDNQGWFRHPYCLAILRRELDDVRPTGAVYRIENGEIVRRTKDGWSSSGLPDWLADPATRRSEAPERNCDVAAEKLNALVAGLPRYHALRKDSQARLTAMKEFLDRFGKRLRFASRLEAEALHLSFWRVGYIPDILPLGSPATAADVKAGKAIFDLGGKGKLAEMPLPAVAILKSDKATVKDHPPHLLIVQAEVDPTGRVTYGAIMPYDVRAISATDVTDIRPLSDLEKKK